jgi:hypothetical protein
VFPLAPAFVYRVVSQSSPSAGPALQSCHHERALSCTHHPTRRQQRPRRRPNRLLNTFANLTHGQLSTTTPTVTSSINSTPTPLLHFIPTRRCGTVLNTPRPYLHTHTPIANNGELPEDGEDRRGYVAPLSAQTLSQAVANYILPCRYVRCRLQGSRLEHSRPAHRCAEEDPSRGRG